jgi:insulysin
MWRIFQLNKHLSAAGHPWGKFGSGNKESLSKAGRDLKAQLKLNDHTDSLSSAGNSIDPSPIPSRKGSPAPSVKSTISINSEKARDGGFVGRETRRRLVEWWTREYCAGRMNLCVIGQGIYFYVDETGKLIS